MSRKNILKLFMVFIFVICLTNTKLNASTTSGITHLAGINIFDAQSTNDATMHLAGFNIESVPVVTCAPVALDAPIVTEVPVVTDAPSITDEPVATKKPKKAKVDKYADLSDIPKYTLEIMNDLGIKKSKQKDFYNRICDISIKTAYREARGEPYEGQIAVIATILNRLKSKEFPDTPEEIVSTAYASYKGVTKEMLEEYPSLKKALKNALEGEDPTREALGQGAYYFYAPESDLITTSALKAREKIKRKCRIGNHIFYAIWDK